MVNFMLCVFYQSKKGGGVYISFVFILNQIFSLIYNKVQKHLHTQTYTYHTESCFANSPTALIAASFPSFAGALF